MSATGGFRVSADLDRGALLESFGACVAGNDGSVQAIVDGEIYNAQRLHELLERHGHGSVALDPAHLLLHLYEDYGHRLVHALDGRYAFAIWDPDAGRLLIGRDRFGELPLFYTSDANGFTAASKLGLLDAAAPGVATPDPEGVTAFLGSRELSGTVTLLSGVSQLPAATLALWSAGEGLSKPQPYWGLPSPLPGLAEPVSQVSAEIEQLCRVSVRRRVAAQDSQRPPGVLLDGGLASSILAWLVAAESPVQVCTFSFGEIAGLDGSHPAIRQAASLSGAEHRTCALADGDVERLVPELLGGLDVPAPTPATAGQLLLSRLARNHTSVVLGTGGADMLFGVGAGSPVVPWLEMRNPYLSRELAELAAQIPESIGRTDGRRAVVRGLIKRALPPRSRAHDRPVGVPAAAWLRGPLAPVMEAQLEKSRAHAEGWLNREALASEWAEHSSGRADRTARLWPALALGLWLDRDGESGA